MSAQMVERTSLTPAHLLLAIAVMAVWGSNFVVIKVALAHLPPLTLAALRFTAVVVPMVFILKRPAASWANLAAYGLLIGAGQFGALFIALRADAPPGLASLIMQTQVFFTIGLSMALTGERLKAVQVVALLLAVGGLGVIVSHTDGSITPLGLGLLLIAAFSWSSGNMVSRAAGKVDMLGYVVWSSLFAVPPLFALAFVFEGPTAMATGIRNADLATWAAVVWQAVGNAMFGYGVWGWMLARYPAATVAPLALLVPVFGMTASAVLLGEPMQDWKLLAALLVMSGLALGILWPRLAERFVRGEPV
jgi:O-acetylserine/cysteine efflux transporter